MIDKVVKNIEAAYDEMGEIDLAGIKLESADPRLLDVTEMDLDRHVAMQPSAMAWVGSLVKEAARMLKEHEKQYERWEKKKYAEAKASLEAGTGKNTVADVQARYIVDNEKEIEKWEKSINKLQAQYDTLSSWIEGWRQKSFAIQQHISMTEDERWTESSVKRDEKNEKKSEKSGKNITGTQRIRDIINKSQNGSDD